MNDTHKMNDLKTVGEFGLIDMISRQVQADSSVCVGIGDDCAATTMPSGHVLLTTKDLLIEDVHFRRCWTSLYQLGRKSAAVNLSDIAAMGGSAHHLFLGVALPEDMALADIEQFTQGFLDEIAAAGATLCGGDTCRSTGSLIVSVTVQGSIAADQVVQRSGAQVGDHIYVSGTLGDSALALAQLQRGIIPDDYLAQRHHTPTPRLQLGQQLAERKLAKAMIDVSDGLCADLGHILEKSHCGALIDRRKIPLSVVTQQHLRQHPEDEELVLRGGEDYELLFCVSPQHGNAVADLAQQLELSLTDIGTIQDFAGGLQQLDSNGQRCTIHTQGFNHFG